MQFLLRFLFLFLFAIVKSQNIDSLANIPSELKETEIRIYKDRGIYNSGFVFRIYKEDKTWKAELVRWFLPYQISKVEFKTISPSLKILKTNKSLEEVFVDFQLRNISYLPKEESFRYKKTIVRKWFLIRMKKLMLFNKN